jgi:hypothetical protein
MRARNVKPSLFKNELLAIADPIYTVVFAGLWCLADRRGRLEDRPAKIHFDINPGRAFEGTSVSLNWLADNGFIARYEVNGTRYVQILNFEKHQNPHHKEPESIIPPMPGAEASCMGGAPGADEPCLEHASAPDRADSGFLIPDSPSLIAHASGSEGSPVAEQGSSVFDQIRAIFPKRSGSHRWQDALNHFRARVREGHSPETILAGVERYATFVREQGNEGSSFVQQAATFLGTNRGFLEDWKSAPPKVNGRSQPAFPTPPRFPS